MKIRHRLEKLMTDIHIAGRAYLVGVSCKSEIGTVSAKGGGLAKIPGVTVFTWVGNIRGRGDADASAVPSIELGEK